MVTLGHAQDGKSVFEHALLTESSEGVRGEEYPGSELPSTVLVRVLLQAKAKGPNQLRKVLRDVRWHSPTRAGTRRTLGATRWTVEAAVWMVGAHDSSAHRVHDGR